MRLPRNEGRWRGSEFAADRGRKGGTESTTCSLDVARGWNDGVSFFFPTGSFVDLQREFRRSCNGAKLCRGCFWRSCLSTRTCKLSTLARSLANFHRCCTGFFRQELTARECRLKGSPLRYLVLHSKSTKKLLTLRRYFSIDSHVTTCPRASLQSSISFRMRAPFEIDHHSATDDAVP
jgi:hypothetical protein